MRNADGGFYVCQAIQNVYRTTRKIKIRWLSQDKAADPSGEIYKPDFYDITGNLFSNEYSISKFHDRQICLVFDLNVSPSSFCRYRMCPHDFVPSTFRHRIQIGSFRTRPNSEYIGPSSGRGERRAGARRERHRRTSRRTYVECDFLYPLSAPDLVFSHKSFATNLNR